MTKHQPPPTLPEIVAAELPQAIGLAMRRLRTEANPGGLSVSQTATLGRLADKGATTTADLARAESMKPQSMGTILNGLEHKGLVVRSPHPTDGRQVLFTLTPKGVEARRATRAAKQAWLLAAITNLDPAQQQILREATALIGRLGEP